MKILVVDDEANIRNSLKIILEQEGYEADCAENGLSAQRMIEESFSGYDAGIFDLKMPGMDGLSLLEWLKNSRKSFPVIMISAFGQISDAVTALKIGAEDYVVKPFDPADLLDKLSLLGTVKVSEGTAQAGSEGENEGTGDFFSGTGPLMARLTRRMERIAQTGSTVLITGESGVGKEVSARIIHSKSPVSGGPFIAVNIGGVPENLLESELFGHEKGAFTGADRQKKGLFELAAGGTLFLDEIGEMSLTLQVKILRVLQDRQFRRLGGLENRTIDARIIAATNRPLEEMISAGEFREDLYYRLNVARLEIPPLRERLDDLPRLTRFLIEKLNARMGLEVKSLSRDAWETLSRYSFPGNIRELENILERGMIFAEGGILLTEDLELPSSSGTPVNPGSSDPASQGRTLKELEKSSILSALRRWEGNRSRAAKELGISRRTIINKIQEYDLEE